MDIKSVVFEEATIDQAEILTSLKHRCLREVNSKEYGEEVIEDLIQKIFTREKTIRNILNTHFYVVKYDEEIVGMGGVTRDLSQLRQSYFISVFISPDYINKGIGRKLIQFLEQDEYCLDSDFIEIPASKSAHKFYNKLGYNYRTNPPVFDEDGATIMYKNIVSEDDKSDA